jgi:hypothetical protein
VGVWVIAWTDGGTDGWIFVLMDEFIDRCIIACVNR